MAVTENPIHDERKKERLCNEVDGDDESRKGLLFYHLRDWRKLKKRHLHEIKKRQQMLSPLWCAIWLR